MGLPARPDEHAAGDPPHPPGGGDRPGRAGERRPWSAGTPGWPLACCTCWRSTSCWPRSPRSGSSPWASRRPGRSRWPSAAASAAWSSPAWPRSAVQLTEYARSANGMAFAVLGVAFLLRAIGDTACQSVVAVVAVADRLGRAVPALRRRALGGPAPAGGPARGPARGRLAALLVRRDVGAGVLPTRLGPGRRPALAAQPARPGLAAPARLPDRLDGRVGHRRPVVRR